MEWEKRKPGGKRRRQCREKLGFVNLINLSPFAFCFQATDDAHCNRNPNATLTRQSVQPTRAQESGGGSRAWAKSMKRLWLTWMTLDQAQTEQKPIPLTALFKVYEELQVQCCLTHCLVDPGIYDCCWACQVSSKHKLLHIKSPTRADRTSVHTWQSGVWEGLMVFLHPVFQC